MQAENFVQTFTFVLTVLQCICIVCSQEDEYKATFMVQPGGQKHTYTGTLDDVTCSFTYVSQGGTNEEWEMKIDKQYACHVIRPEKESYLFFMQFELKIKGAKLTDAVVFKNRDMKEMSSNEYVKHFSDSAVRQSSSFNGQMNGVIAMATKQKEDL